MVVLLLPGLWEAREVAVATEPQRLSPVHLSLMQAVVLGITGAEHLPVALAGAVTPHLLLQAQPTQAAVVVVGMVVQTQVQAVPASSS